MLLILNLEIMKKKEFAKILNNVFDIKNIYNKFIVNNIDDVISTGEKFVHLNIFSDGEITDLFISISAKKINSDSLFKISLETNWGEIVYKVDYMMMNVEEIIKHLKICIEKSTAYDYSYNQVNLAYPFAMR